MYNILVFAGLCCVAWGYTVQDSYPLEYNQGYSSYPQSEYLDGPLRPAYRQPIPYHSGYADERYIDAPYYQRSSGYPYHPRGEIVNKQLFRNGQENYNDGVYEKAHGHIGEQADHGRNGYNQNQFRLKDAVGDSEHYSDIEGARRAHENGKQYQGAQFHNQGGQNENKNKQQQGHKKGHTVKGFKHSHHKDETGKTEEYFDEANDEGDNLNFNGQSGIFKENQGSSFKGEHEDGLNNEKVHKTAGYYDNNHFVDKVNTDHGKFGENRFSNNGRVYGRHNGVDQESLLGSQETNKFYKHSPYLDNFYKYKK
ncbi:unnamed protein product [Brassicogethes aeneus]|uniref:Uncharacterized protein n=1 Tax=Brassicogethes aeneus TaxID=1431903 RepID=A0A9P0B195_BRAAE|nr:unnamed protein product [Brassicogethes aeneus]